MKISPAKWFKQQSFLLARATYTPISFWIEMTTAELITWIRDINATTKEE